MFLFQSSKDKKIRLTVQQKLQRCIDNPSRYKQSMETIMSYIKASDQKVIKMVVDKIKATIKQQNIQPTQKLQCILLLRDLMSTHNKVLGKYVVEKILKRLTIFAEYKKESNQQDRGKDIFGKQKNKDQQQASIKFLNTLLNAIQQWRNWPKSPDGPHIQFKKAYEDLLFKKVTFPKQRKIIKEPSLGGTVLPPTSGNRKSLGQKQETPYPYSQKQGRGSITPNPQRPIGKKQNISKPLLQHFKAIIENIQLLTQILDSDQTPDIQFLADIATQVQNTINKGDQHIARLMQDPQANKGVIEKLQKSFEVSEKLQKDTKIIQKNQSKYEIYKSKYLKLGKQLIVHLSHYLPGGQNQNASSMQRKNEQSPYMQQSRPKLNAITSAQNNQSPNPRVPKIASPRGDINRNSLSPAIRQTNPYNSTHNLHLKLQQQKQISKQQFNSGSSQRFGSIGNPNALSRAMSNRSVNQKQRPSNFKEASQRQQKERNQHDSSQSQSNYQDKSKKMASKKYMPQITEEKNQSQFHQSSNNRKMQSGFPAFNNSQNRFSSKQEVSQSHTQHQNKNFQSNSKINSFNSNSFNNRQKKTKDDFDDFNNQIVQKKNRNDSSQEDFFQKIQDKDKNAANHVMMTRKQRRGNQNLPKRGKTNQNVDSPQNFFNVQIENKNQDSSSGLSAFKQENKGQSSNSNSRSIPHTQNKIDSFQKSRENYQSNQGSQNNKKNLSSSQSPSKLGLSINVSQIYKKQPEKFGFDSKTNPFEQDYGLSFRKKANPSNYPHHQNSQRQSIQNPFQTHYQNPRQVDDNYRFDQQTFERKSQHSQVSKNSNPFSEKSNKNDNPFAKTQNEENPFQATSRSNSQTSQYKYKSPNDNPFYKNSHVSSKNQNPFQTHTFQAPNLHPGMNFQEVIRNSFQHQQNSNDFPEKNNRNNNNLRDFLRNSEQDQSRHQQSIDRQRHFNKNQLNLQGIQHVQNPFETHNLSRTHDNPFGQTNTSQQNQSERNSENGDGNNNQVFDFIHDFNKQSSEIPQSNRSHKNNHRDSLNLVVQRVGANQGFNFEDFDVPNNSYQNSNVNRDSKVSKQSSHNSNIFNSANRNSNDFPNSGNFGQIFPNSNKIQHKDSQVSKHSKKSQFGFSDFGKQFPPKEQLNLSDFNNINNNNQSVRQSQGNGVNWSQFDQQKDSQKSKPVDNIKNSQKGFGFSQWGRDTQKQDQQQSNRQSNQNFRFSDFGKNSNNSKKQNLSNQNTQNDFFKQTQKSQNPQKQQMNDTIKQQAQKKSQKELQWKDFQNFNIGDLNQRSSVSRQQNFDNVRFDQQSHHSSKSQNSRQRHRQNKKPTSLQKYSNQRKIHDKNNQTDSYDFPAASITNNSSQYIPNKNDQNSRKNIQTSQPNQKPLTKNTQFAKKPPAQYDVSQISQQNQDKSLSIQFQDFSPITKKGISWNPIKKINNQLQIQSQLQMNQIQKSYNITKDDIIKKKKQLQLKQNLYNKEVQRFQKFKQANIKAKNSYVEELSKGQDIITQKQQYQKMLKKLLDNNQMKQKQIDQINNRIKKAQDIKNKILQKEKLLFEKIKENQRQHHFGNQIYSGGNNNINQKRNNTSKWQLFNKNIQNLRNTTNQNTSLAYNLNQYNSIDNIQKSRQKQNTNNIYNSIDMMSPYNYNQNINLNLNFNQNSQRSYNIA